MGRKERMCWAQERKVEEVDANEHMEAMSSLVMMVARRAEGSSSRLASISIFDLDLIRSNHTRTCCSSPLRHLHDDDDDDDNNECEKKS